MGGQAASLPVLVACLILGVLATASSREVSPETVAVEYVRALYARDLSQAYRLLSAQDREQKTEAAYVAEGDVPTGNVLSLARLLASFIEILSAEGKFSGDRAKVKLRLRLPDGNAPEVAALVRDWDVAALNALSNKEAERIRKDLDRLHRSGSLPTLEGEEAFELVKEPSGWRLVLHWARTIRVRFTARIPEGLSLQVDPLEQELLARPGQPLQMSIRLRNGSEQDLSLRIAHGIEPKDAAPFLVFLHCPLLLPVKLPPREGKGVSTSFMIADSVPEQTRDVQVTFLFRRTE
jgi:hypothetical protein